LITRDNQFDGTFRVSGQRLLGSAMIRSFRSKALRQFWEEENRRGLRPDLVDRIADLLDILDLAEVPEDTNAGGTQFHGLRGKPKRFALSVNKN
jgi:toxin HigB-1